MNVNYSVFARFVLHDSDTFSIWLVISRLIDVAAQQSTGVFTFTFTFPFAIAFELPIC